MADVAVYVLMTILALAAAGVFAFSVLFGRLWLRAYSAGCPVPVREFVGMFLRRIDARLVVDVLILARRAGLSIAIDRLQAHVLLGGDMRATVEATIFASRCGLDLSFDFLAGIDLFSEGEDVTEYVRREAEKAGRSREESGEP